MEMEARLRSRGASPRFSLLFIAVFSMCCASGCTFSLDWYRQYRAKLAIEAHDYPTGLEILQKVVQSNPDSPSALEASRFGAKVAHLNAKNYTLAIEFLRHLQVRSSDADERKQAQKSIAQIEFENVQDFNQAVLEYEKLLRLEHSPDEGFRYRLNIAKSQLHLSNIEQAVTELDILLAQKHSADEVFEARVLKANTFIAAKRMHDAVSAWQDILKEFPDRSKKENVALNLVVIYEELKQFDKAIEVLESMREGYAHPDFLDVRIQRLRQRMGNQPGARGLKR